MSELLSENVDNSLAAALGRDPSGIRLEKLNGGFAGTEKYIIHDSGNNSPDLFAKIITKNAPPNEVAAIRAEIQNYHLLDSLGLTGNVFPRMLQEVDSDVYVGLVLDYYNDVTWAGPWNETSIMAVYEMFSTIHSTALSDTQKETLARNKSLLGDAHVPFADYYLTARQAFHDTKTIVNSRGDSNFDLPDERLFEAMAEIPATDDSPSVLIAQDANKYNICLDTSEHAHIVDPVYLNLGSPYQDLLNIGHDIIGSLDPGVPEIALVKELFIPKDKHNQHVLDGIAYGLMASQKPYTDNPAWMDYQQDSLVIKLKLWYDLI